mgnify:CR=1 FL=1|jgi:hypothetical protein
MNLDFSDRYKFLSSLGVALVILSLTGSWLFYKEPYDLLIEVDQINKLTPIAQKAIEVRQFYIERIFEWLWLAPAVATSAGTGLVAYGLWGWSRKDADAIAIGKASDNLKNFSVRPATEDEIEYRAENISEYVGNFEIHNFEIDEDKGDPSRAQIESKVVNFIANVAKDTYDSLVEYKFGDVYADLLLKSRNVLLKDYIFEVKIINKGFNFDWLKEVVTKLRYAGKAYSLVSNKIPNTVIVIISNVASMKNEKYSKIYSDIYASGAARSGKDRILFTSKNNLLAMSNAEARKFLGI